MMAPNWQVIIADIRASRQLTPALRARLPLEVRKALRPWQALGGDAFRLAPEVLKGDEIQTVLRPDAPVLQLVTYLRAKLADATAGALKLRVGIGGGPIDRMSRKGPFESDGPAFHRARAALEQARADGGARATAWQLGVEHFDRLADGVLGLYDAVTMRWTVPQWEAVMARIEGKELRVIAAASDVSIQSVSKRLLTASWTEVRGGAELLEQLARLELAEARAGQKSAHSTRQG